MNMIKPMKVLSILLAVMFCITDVSAKELDPLSQAEVINALSLSTPQRRSSQLQNDPAADLELLLIERRPADKDAPVKRLADIYHYDYSRDETVHTIIDLDSQTTLTKTRHQFLQLPLTENEIANATQIIFSDQEQLRLLSHEYLKITGRYLTTPAQLNIKAFAFTAESMPEQLNVASQQCGLNRCAQVLLYTADSVVFEVSPIVNLSAGIVTQNIGY